MGYYIDTSYLPRLRSYEEAQSEFNILKPVRGAQENMRRLAKRSDQHKWIKHEIRDGIDVYITGLYSTELIAFYPTHREISVGGWWTMSTKEFIWKVGNIMMANYSSRAYVPAGFMDTNEVNGFINGYPIKVNETYKFNYQGEALEPQKHPKLTKYKINRKKMNEARKPYQPFIEYVKTMNNLIHETTDISEYQSDSRLSISSVVDEGESVYWEMYRNIAREATHRNWYSNNFSWKRDDKAMMNIIDGMIKSKSQYVLEEVSLGKLDIASNYYL